MSQSTLYLIQFYQRYISPYKGFRCAHAAYYHGDSCSGAVSKIIRRQGLVNGFIAIKNQFSRCSQAYLALKQKIPKRKKDNSSLAADCVLSGVSDVATLPCECLLSF
jgi:putative component of membrane protein insertase Oxa1/YidC/SpoIIIJ protein YidD